MDPTGNRQPEPTRRDFLRHARDFGAACAAAYLLSPWAPRVAWGQVRGGGADVTAEQVRVAIRRGLTHLGHLQRGDGSWPDQARAGGTTALAVLAMLNAGVPAEDRAVAAGLRHLRLVRNQETYVVALKCMAFAAADPEAYRQDLVDAAKWLAQAQTQRGTWGYTADRSGWDNSNTQFALLGLHEAALAGVPIPGEVWRLSHQHYTRSQNEDGGWAYTDSQESYGSMTAAAVASLFITGDQLHVGREIGYVNGAAPGCARYAQNVSIAAGLRWLTLNFSVTENPRRGGQWHRYYLYALERVGMTGGLRYIGQHDWYREGAAQLVRQQQASGAWGDLSDTAFALLFLAKGNRPLLLQKLQWPGLWNPDRNDAANLVGFIDGQLGQPVAWQVVGLEEPVTSWLASPILYVQGHTFPRFAPAHVEKLRQYVENGGTLLFEACCSTERFHEGFAAFVPQAFPEYGVRELGLDHPVFHAFHDLDRTHGVMGIDVGCRTSVFYLPNDVSCLWEQRQVPHAQELADFAFRFGLNLAAYATGRQPMADRLAEVVLAAEPTERVRASGGRGAVQIARLVHAGDYNADPHALSRLADLAAESARIDVIPRDRPLRATDEELFDHPVVVMTGHFAFELAEEEGAALKTYLERGGTLLAEACCGREAFDRSFRDLAGKLLDGQPLQPLAADHPLFRSVGRPIGEVRLRPEFARQIGQETLPVPRIEGGAIGGRLAILYSPLDWTCGLEGDKPFACRGYVDEDAKVLGLSLLLFAVSF